jgi:hypothetical protein
MSRRGIPKPKNLTVASNAATAGLLFRTGASSADHPCPDGLPAKPAFAAFVAAILFAAAVTPPPTKPVAKPPARH